MLTDLIERLEAATGPDRDLDRDIFVATKGWVLTRIPADYDGKNASEVYTPPGGFPNFSYPPRGAIHPHYHVPSDFHPTASIDAAVTLVPSNCLAMTRTLWDGEATAGYASVSRYSALPGRMFLDDYVGTSPVAAIALCIAALKARSGGTQ